MKTQLIKEMQSGGRLFSKLAPAFITQINSSLASSSEEPSSIRIGKYYKSIPTDSCFDFLLKTDSKKFIFTKLHERDLTKVLNKIQKNLSISDLHNETLLKKLNALEEDLKSSFPEIFKIYKSSISSFIILKTDLFGGASHPHMYGNIFLSDDLLINKSQSEICLSVIHEMAHQELFLLNLVDRLADKAYDHSLEYAPYQNKLRPPIGRLHSCHALFRMLHSAKNIMPENQQTDLINKFKQNIKGFKPGELTSYGEEIVKNIYKPFSADLNTIRVCN